jgi:hypothetical protein
MANKTIQPASEINTAPGDAELPFGEQPEPAKDWARLIVRGRQGKTPSERQVQLFLKAVRPPTFRFGHTEVLFPSRANAHLARLAEEQNQPPQRGRGRPRAIG